MRAVVIDDSMAIRKYLGQILWEIGFEVAEAGNGQEALDLLREIEAVDLALVDWNMPVMDGYEFVRAVRSDGNYDDLVLMMVTSEAEDSQIVKAIEAGANGYVMKPFTKTIILEKLDILGMRPS